MHLKTISLALAILLLSTPASSQDNSWDIRFEAAMSKDVPSQKIDALIELLGSEPDYQNRIIAGYNAMISAYEVERYETATNIGEQTLKLTDEHAVGNLKQRDAIASVVINAYYRNGNPNEARRVTDANLAMNDAALDDLWSSSDKSITHRFSAMVCPNQLDSLYREHTRVYHPMGIDVGCDYKVYNGEDNSVSVYFTKYDLSTSSTKKAHDDVMQTVKTNWGDANLVIDNQIADFKTSTNDMVRESLFRLGSVQKGYRYTGTWTSVIGSWILKSRITWDGALGEKFGHTHAKALLQNTSADIKSHLKFCNIAPPENEAKRLNANSTQSLTSLLTLATANIDSKNKQRPIKSCMGEASQEGNAIMEWYDNSHRLYSIVGSSVDEDVYVSAVKLTGLINKSEPVRYSLKSVQIDSEKEETITKVLTVYTGQPNQSQVFRDYVAYRKGELQILGSIVRDKNGDTQVNVVGMGKK